MSFFEMLAAAFAEYAAEDEHRRRMLTDETKPLGHVPVTGDPPEHEGHDCPNCSERQTFCREGDSDTRHSHVCWKCGTKWQHVGRPFPF